MLVVAVAAPLNKKKNHLIYFGGKYIYNINITGQTVHNTQTHANLAICIISRKYPYYNQNEKENKTLKTNLRSLRCSS